MQFNNFVFHVLETDEAATGLELECLSSIAKVSKHSSIVFIPMFTTIIKLQGLLSIWMSEPKLQSLDQQTFLKCVYRAIQSSRIQDMLSGDYIEEANFAYVMKSVDDDFEGIIITILGYNKSYAWSPRKTINAKATLSLPMRLDSDCLQVEPGDAEDCERKIESMSPSNGGKPNMQLGQAEKESLDASTGSTPLANRNLDPAVEPGQLAGKLPPTDSLTGPLRAPDLSVNLDYSEHRDAFDPTGTLPPLSDDYLDFANSNRDEMDDDGMEWSWRGNSVGQEDYIIELGYPD